MRVLVLTPTFLPVWGGAERLLYEVLIRLVKRHEVYMLTPRQPPHVLQRHQQAPQLHIPFPIHRYTEKHRWDQVRGRRLHRGFFPPFGLSAISTTQDLVRRLKPDVIHVYYAIPTGLAGLIARWRYHIPMVLSFIGRDVPGPDTPAGWGYYDRLLANAADEVTFVSHYCRKAIYGHRASTKGIIIGAGVHAPLRVSPEQVLALRQRLRIDADTVVLFALQRLSSYKGVDVLIRGMEHLIDVPCVLLIAGSGTDRPRLEALVAERSLQDRVRFLGFVEEETLPAYWALADLFLFHSYYETFGLVIAEAMAAGKAVVSVRNTAIPEVVEDGVTGLLVEPGNPQALAAAIRQLIRAPEKRQAMGKAGSAKAMRLYSWDAVAQAYETALQGALAYG